MNSKIVTVNDVKYLITNEHDAIQSKLVNNQQWNSEIVDIIKEFVKKYNLKHFLNIGSHIGTVCLPISKIINDVTAIEAYNETYIHLLTNIEINGIKNVKTFNIAIGDRKEEINFLKIVDRTRNNMGGMHVITKRDIENNSRSSELVDETKKCNMYPLDEVDEIDNFDILLVDIEGMDENFLIGAKNKIIKNKPIIIMEIWSDYKRRMENMKLSQKDIIDMIEGFGYKLYKIMEDDFIFLPIV